MLRDLDSDRDGLSDYEEICQYSTNPCGIDSDGVDTNDGVTSGPGGDDAGALPDGYSTGLGPEPTANGCDCTTGDSPRGAMGFGLMLLALLGLRRGRRRS